MTINHIDQLREWWESAEEGVIEKGDTVINRSDGETTVYVAAERGRRLHLNSRILARAPKPKPAWHDAVAVVASTSDFGIRRVFVKDVDGIWNDALSARGSSGGKLRDVTPLIEAKVTDAMVEAARQEAKSSAGLYLEISLASRMLTAALGLETE